MAILNKKFKGSLVDQKEEVMAEMTDTEVREILEQTNDIALCLWDYIKEEKEEGSWNEHTLRFLAVSLKALTDQVAKIEKLESYLRGIRDYPPEGHGRRTEDGYPEEICYDEFAYKRIVDSYREIARQALKKEKT